MMKAKTYIETQLVISLGMSEFVARQLPLPSLFELKVFHLQIIKAWFNGIRYEVEGLNFL